MQLRYDVCFLFPTKPRLEIKDKHGLQPRAAAHSPAWLWICGCGRRKRRLIIFRRAARKHKLYASSSGKSSGDQVSTTLDVKTFSRIHLRTLKRIYSAFSTYILNVFSLSQGALFFPCLCLFHNSPAAVWIQHMLCVHFVFIFYYSPDCFFLLFWCYNSLLSPLLHKNFI